MHGRSLIRTLHLALALLAAVPAGAQNARQPADGAAGKKKPPPVNMVVTVGQQGFARAGRQVPVKVVLDNNSDGVSGYLELRGLGDRQSTRMPVDLPRGAHKEYTLFATLSPDADDPQYASAELRLYGGNRELVRQKLAPRYPEDQTIVVSATGDGSGLQFLADERVYRVEHTSPQDLPRLWAGYEPADVVALNGRAWSQMDDQQRRAFRMWVEHGGRAVLCGESLVEWKDPEGLALAGVTPRDLRSEASLQCVTPWGREPYAASAGMLLTVSGPLRPGSEVLFHEGGRPLIVQRRALHGQVLWLGFDGFRQTFREWRGSLPFWRQAVREARRAGTEPAVTMVEDIDEVRQTAASLPRLPAPPLWAIIGFGVVYAVIFGPINIWVLRRLRRTVRSWLFTPALAAAMTLVALGAGQSWGSARTVLSGITVLETASGSRTAAEQGLVCLFSPTNRDFDLAVEDAAPQVDDLGGVGPQDAPPLTSLGWPDQQQDGVVRWDSTAQQLFSARLLRLRRPADLGGTVEVRLAEGARPTGTVRNGSFLALKRAYLVRNGRFYSLGDLKTGATVPLQPGEWRDRLPNDGRSAQAVGELQENTKFREGMDRLWAGARDLLVMQGGRADDWLVAECPDYRPGLDVARLQYNNRSALLLVRVPRAGQSQ